MAEACHFNVHPSADDPPSNLEGIDLVIGDVRDFQTCYRCCQGVDLVIHLAASTGVISSVGDPRFDFANNVLGTFNMLEAARLSGIAKFIFASSGAPLGESNPPINEEKVPKPVSPYGASKLAGEGYCSAYYRTFGMNTISLRFGNVYGPRSKQKTSVIAKFIKQGLAGETLEINGDGAQTRDFLYIDDLLDALILSTASNCGGEVFQIATSQETTVNEIAIMVKEFIEKVAGKIVNIRYTPPLKGEVVRNYSDISKARALLGFDPKYDIRTGLQETVRYFLRIPGILAMDPH